MKMINTILIFTVLFFSCEKECNLPKQIIGTGEIVEEALVTQPLITWEMRDKEHVIQIDSLNIYDLEVSFDNNLTYQSIDFNKYTLLGKYAREKCQVVFERSVSRNNSQKKIYYDIKIYQCGSCKTNWESMNWVLVPKIPDDYEVVFDVIEK